MATTNNGGNFWSIALASFTEAQAVAITHQTIVTSADTVATWTKHEGTVVTPTGNVADPFLGLACTKSSTPGNMTIIANIKYRQIVP